MTSAPQAQTVVGVLLVAALFLALMLVQAWADKEDPRCGRARSYMNPGCQEAAVHFRD